MNYFSKFSTRGRIGKFHWNLEIGGFSMAKNIGGKTRGKRLIFLRIHNPIQTVPEKS